MAVQPLNVNTPQVAPTGNENVQALINQGAQAGTAQQAGLNQMMEGIRNNDQGAILAGQMAMAQAKAEFDAASNEIKVIGEEEDKAANNIG